MIDKLLERLQNENIPFYAMTEEQLKRVIEITKELIEQEME